LYSNVQKAEGKIEPVKHRHGRYKKSQIKPREMKTAKLKNPPKTMVKNNDRQTVAEKKISELEDIAMKCSRTKQREQRLKKKWTTFSIWKCVIGVPQSKQEN
jgi:hypothetical protein